MIRRILLRITESYFRHPLLYLLPILVMLILGAVWLTVREETYIARGSIAVNTNTVTEKSLGIGANNFFWKTPAEATAQQFDELLSSDAMIRAIISYTDLESDLADPTVTQDSVIESARNSVWVAPIGHQHFAVYGSGETPEVAYQLVEATMSVYLDWHRSLDLVDARSSVDFFTSVYDADMADFEDAQAKLEEFLVNNPEPVRGDRTQIEEVEIKNLERNANDASVRVASSRTRLAYSEQVFELAQTEAGDNYQVVDRPGMPTDPAQSLTQSIVSVALFGALGVVLSGMFLAFNALRDHTLRYPVDIAESFGIVTLARIPIDPNQA